MSTPLESSFLVPNASLFITLGVMLLVVALLVSGLLWLLVGRRGTAARR